MARTLDCSSSETLSKLCDLEKLSLQNVRSDSNLGGEKGGMVRQQLLEELPEGQVTLSSDLTCFNSFD